MVLSKLRLSIDKNSVLMQVDAVEHIPNNFLFPEVFGRATLISNLGSGLIN